jgi:hypothetical protein
VVPILAAGASSSGPIAGITVVVPNNTPSTYFLIAVPTMRGGGGERRERQLHPSASKAAVGRPDLVSTAVSNPPAIKGELSVTDTVENQPFQRGRLSRRPPPDEAQKPGDLP